MRPNLKADTETLAERCTRLETANARLRAECYCGHATGGGSWCPHHARLVYAPPKPRRAA